MTIAFLFWLLMILALIFGFWRGYSDVPNRPIFGMSFLLWILLFLLGWQTFGFPIRGVNICPAKSGNGSTSAIESATLACNGGL